MTDTTTNPLLALFESGQVVVGDGAMGTMLQGVGLTDGGAPEIWNVEQPEALRASTRPMPMPEPVSSPPTRLAAIWGVCSSTMSATGSTS